VLAPSRGDGTTSPTVTLIQDQTNKLDKNVNRVVGLIERLAIRGKGEEEFIPEEGGTPEEQDSRATRLLKRMNEADRSRELRRDLFPAAPKK
ncbi:MAG: hypothetical protein Q8O40_10560, partial [Chloroflexota bacterium]|nr:hypothetical protein [Chloroflexota bacterium]